MTNAISTTSLTPDALMTYCEAQLSSIDGQVDTEMDGAQQSNSESQGLQSVIGAVQAHSSGVTSDAQACSKMETALQTLITQMRSSDPANSQLGNLIQTYNNMVWSGTGPTATNPYIDQADYPPVQTGPQGDGTLSGTEMSTYISTLQGCASALDSGSELQMIQIQSLMSQRQTAISLTTNLVQSLGDQANTIAGNIGH